jgi:hypothetical protein
MKIKRHGKIISEIYFTFKDIGHFTQNLLDNFFKHKFLQYPFSKISALDYKKILEQTVRLNIFVKPIL